MPPATQMASVLLPAIKSSSRPGDRKRRQANMYLFTALISCYAHLEALLSPNSGFPWTWYPARTLFKLFGLLMSSRWRIGVSFISSFISDPHQTDITDDCVIIPLEWYRSIGYRFCQPYLACRASWLRRRTILIYCACVIPSSGLILFVGKGVGSDS